MKGITWVKYYSMPNLHFEIQLDTEMIIHPLPALVDEGEVILGSGVSAVQDEIGVATGNPGLSSGPAFHSDRIEHPPGRIPCRILEDAAAAPFHQRLPLHFLLQYG